MNYATRLWVALGLVPLCGLLSCLDSKLKDDKKDPVQVTQSHVGHDPYFDSLIQKFNDDYFRFTGKSDLQKAYVEFGEVFDGTNRIAYCEILFDKPHVVISKQFWESISPALQLQLVYHELGHCLLGRSHNESKRSDGSPLSVMSSKQIAEKTFVDAYEYYLRELFTGYY